MSGKLSELLEIAIESTEAKTLFSEADQLRAIAPALVDVVAELQHHAEHGWHDHCDKTLCRACILASVMKEAGVTCE